MTFGLNARRDLEHDSRREFYAGLFHISSDLRSVRGILEVRTDPTQFDNPCWVYSKH